MQDPRHKNVIFEGNLEEIVGSYAALISRGLKEIDCSNLKAAGEAICKAAISKKTIYSIGNGGSSAISEHLCCDMTKGTHHQSHPVIKTSSLTSNMALYTALCNDFSFESALEKQVGFFGEQGDVLIAISSSGNSENILRAVKLAKDLGMTVIGLSGFSGGRLKSASDISLHIPIENYGVVEDCHQALIHILAQYIARARDRGEVNAL